MKLKIIVVSILSLTFAHGDEAGQFVDRDRESVISKEIPSGQVLLMLQARFQDESSLIATYAGPLLFIHNKHKESLRAVEISMENCCSDQKFLIRHLGGLKPMPFWNSLGIQSMKGRSIVFPGKFENNQIVPNEKVKISHFRVLAGDGSGTAVIFIIGPIDEVKKAYKIRLGQVFTWESAEVLE